MLWLWCWSVAVPPIRPLAWKLSYATGVALKKKVRVKKQTFVCRVNNHNPYSKVVIMHINFLFSLLGIVVNGLVNISISTIEKRYELKSSLTGLISSSYDISFCLLSLFVSYIGERGHKPRWLAFASFMLGLGALVFSLPKFFSGRYQLGSLFEGKFYCVFVSFHLRCGMKLGH